MKKWGTIFDWDGVIIDSSRYHEESWERLAREEGRALPVNHFRRGFGMKNEVIIPQILKWTEDRKEINSLGHRKEELYREIIAENGIAPLPRVSDFLHALRLARIPCAIGSSTPRANITCTLEVLGFHDYFDALVCAEDVRRGKPDPEVFLLAAGKIRIPPNRCVVFEDAQVGIRAAHAARMKVIAIASTHPPDPLKDADKVVRRLDELTIEELNSRF